MSNTKKIKAKKVNQTKQVSVLGKIWEGLKYFVSSWFKNDTCVDARKKPWYLAVIIAIVSLIVAVIPTMVSNFKVKGGSFLEGTTYNIDSQVYAFTADMKAKGVELKVENGTLTDANNTWAAKYGADTPYKHTVTMDVAYTDNETGALVTKSETYVDFAVYFYPEAVYSVKKGDTTSTALTTYVTEQLAKSNPLAGDEVVGETFTINALFLGKESFVIVKYKGVDSSSGSVSRSSMIGKFTAVNQNGDSSYLLTSLLSDEGKDATIENWKAFLTKAYTPIKIASGWTSTGITFGIYAGLTLVLGFVVWIMTRGKSNPFRIYTIWECQKIAYWAAFAPAVLGMILGFFMSNMVMLGFIMFFGVRIMWMSMRSLKPYEEAK